MTSELSYDLGRRRTFHPALLAVIILAALVVGAGLAWEPYKLGFIIIGLLFCVLPFINLEAGFYGMIIMLPIPEARLAMGDSSISFASVIMVSVVLCIVSRRIVRRQDILGFRLRDYWPLWLFMLAQFASFATSVNLPQSVITFVHLITWVLLLLLIPQVVTDRRMLRNVMIILVLEALVITFVGYYNNYINKIEISALYHYTGGVASIFSNRNQYGHYLIMVLPLTVAFSLFYPVGKTRLLNFVALCSLGISLVATFSRGAWMGAAAAMAVFMRNWRAWVLGLLIIISLLMFTPENIRTRFQSLWDPRIHSANESRILVQLSGLALWAQHPILGVGTGNFERAVSKVRISSLLPSNLSAHNTYLEMLGETGVVGFIAFIMLLVFITKSLTGIKLPEKSTGADRAFKLGLVSTWVAMLTHYIVITAFFNGIAWFMMGLMLAGSKILRESSNPVEK